MPSTGPAVQLSLPFAEVRRWLFEEAAPLWAHAGLDMVNGGYHETLHFSGAPGASAFKRVRVVARQIYVYSHASLLGFADGARVADHGMRFLTSFGWQGAAGWARVLAPDGAVRDATPDLYDHAFVLFALAWRFRAYGDGDARSFALQTLKAVDTHFRHPGGEGFLNALPPEGPRQQNPHMHLLEASLAAYEAFGDERFAALAQELTTLFERRLFDPVTGTLAEFFNDDWSRAAGETGRRVEPGHHFEWAWILKDKQRLLGGDMTAHIEALVGFAERHGISPEGFTMDALRDDGAIVEGGSRTWPNTERIKGHLALFERTGRDPRTPVLQATRLLLDRYFNVPVRGGWMDRFDAAGAGVAKDMPTSTFYHVFLAFAELLRLEPQLTPR
jgi:N-acylglucosamine 2-epimerase/mannose-6-phosphate isomerase